MSIKLMKLVAKNYYGSDFRIVDCYKIKDNTGAGLSGRVTLIHKQHQVVHVTFFNDFTFTTDSLITRGKEERFLNVSNWIKEV